MLVFRLAPEFSGDMANCRALLARMELHIWQVPVAGAGKIQEIKAYLLGDHHCGDHEVGTSGGDATIGGRRSRNQQPTKTRTFFFFGRFVAFFRRISRTCVAASSKTGVGLGGPEKVRVLKSAWRRILTALFFKCSTNGSKPVSLEII